MEKSAGNEILGSVEKSVSTHFNKDASFVLGVSGGPDSMALLYLFHSLKLDVLVVHINYEKRGKESDLDQELVEEMAFQWEFECCSVRVNSRDAEGKNFQNWARDQRYRIFNDLREEHDADAVATAHHQNDQLETILQKVFRGSSPAAWQGMSKWDGHLFRPLLNFNKQEILDFCESASIPFRIDESNLESDFARNFLRHEFSSTMDQFFPGWQKNVLALQKQGSWFDESIKYIAEKISKNHEINLPEFVGIPDEVKPAVIKYLLENFDENVDLSKSQLKELSEIENLQTGKYLKAGKIILLRDREKVLLRKREEIPVFAHIIKREEVQKGLELKRIHFLVKDSLASEEGLYIDTDKLYWPLTLRTWEKGDRIIPFGMEGSQKLSDHLINRKIASHLKEKTLVLCGSDGTIYAIIYPDSANKKESGTISELVKGDINTTKYLTIKPK